MHRLLHDGHYSVDWWSIPLYLSFVTCCHLVSSELGPVDVRGKWNRIHNLFMSLVVSPVALLCPVYILYRMCILTGLDPLRAMFAGSADFLDTEPTIRFALSLIVATKYVEWMDTMWLIFRHRPVQLLHYVHHATIVVIFQTGFASGGWAFTGVANSLIHIVMYAYYAKIALLIPLARYITTCQIAHLSIGGMLSLYTYFVPVCKADIDGKLSLCTFTLMGTYVALFVRLYVGKYTARDKVS